MTKTMTKADSLRAALKTAGFNARAVSVRYDHTTLRVTVRRANVSLAAVAQIANAFESISRDESGEILCGGNTFVDVSYERAILAPYTAAVTAKLLASPERVVVAIGQHRAFWCGSRFDTEVATLTELLNGRDLRAYGLNHGAEQIAIDLLSRGEGAGLLAAAPAVMESAAG